mmetsp:Transcript_17916/g.26421  ORF Transcript_17916/g.26421 Transcript_17916/m.26421 type:complete len:101 (+) Transcript_17916:60-362(+)
MKCLLKTAHQACCCLICVLCCACEGCTIYRALNDTYLDETQDLMIDCMKEVARKNAEQRKQYFLDKCRSFECRVTVCGKYKLNFIAGTGTLATRVCRQGF